MADDEAAAAHTRQRAWCNRCGTAASCTICLTELSARSLPGLERARLMGRLSDALYELGDFQGGNDYVAALLDALDLPSDDDLHAMCVPAEDALAEIERVSTIALRAEQALRSQEQVGWRSPGRGSWTFAAYDPDDGRNWDGWEPVYQRAEP